MYAGGVDGGLCCVAASSWWGVSSVVVVVVVNGVVVGFGFGFGPRMSRVDVARDGLEQRCTPLPFPAISNRKSSKVFLSFPLLQKKWVLLRRREKAFETAKRKEIEGLPELAAAAVKEELKLSRADLATKVIESLG